MKRFNLVQCLIALVGLVVVPILPFLSIKLLGISFWGVSMFKGITGFYPIFLIPVIGSLVLVLMSFDDLKPINTIAGVVMLIIHILFFALKNSVILSGDMNEILTIASGVLSRFTGDITDLSAIKMFLEPLLKPGLGFYLALVVDVLYIVAGVMFSAKPASGSKGGHYKPVGGTSDGGSSSSGRYKTL